MIQIPTMTHPLSSAWDQPGAHELAVYDDIAIMDHSTLARLHNYSASIPTGVYEGKMWRCATDSGGSQRNYRGDWELCWYGPSDDPDKCSINRRPIRLIRDLPAPEFRLGFLDVTLD